ncbi:MAG: hypothetical protein HOB98_07690 [Gammaproteobacteria bacterium]|jgi:hypothetical protein|nr:hypothetical protein [Gammaproteobacteria bacterium]MBT4616312.1 hypothetical protein [Gammaproteobacteria bacterium]MBT5199023.1 hypothetical protein [Gammaproteobacteria bacterium]MBT5791037.1 hypothetical protein [Gammaproteobacteria bacterium]MBT6571886.1 hypothetical protein [Gammaproteobacteria bacterium]
MAWKIWICVPVLYALFAAWYFNWQGPISTEEVNRLMLDFDKLEGSEHTDSATFRKFLEEDDGGEFVMLNLVQLHTGEVAHPLTGEAMSASDLVGEYFGPFAVSLFKRGGHPVFQARTIGGNIDSWNADHNVGFGATAMMRYKSRRDIAELILDPAFSDAHIYKLASIDRTISYPTRIMMSTVLQPPSAVLVVLILLASLVQNLSFLIRP